MCGNASIHSVREKAILYFMFRSLFYCVQVFVKIKEVLGKEHIYYLKEKGNVKRGNDCIGTG